MSKPKEADIKKVLRNIAQDILTNESALLKTGYEGENDYKLVRYSKIELGGDTVGFASKDSKIYNDLNKALINSSAANRKAVWHFLLKALT